jgi:hypothetical protein
VEPAVTYWTNDVPVALTCGSFYAETSGIAVQNGDVYVSGSLCTVVAPECNVAAYWKNGTAVPLTQAEPSAASGIALSGANVYVSINQTASGALSSGNNAAVAINGTVTPLSTSGESAANCVVASGNDIYVGGASRTPRPTGRMER